MQKNTIIFDFDGTLGDSMPYIFKVANKMAIEYGFKQITREEFDKLRDKSPFEIIQQLRIPLLKVPFILHRGKQLLKRHMKEVSYIPGMRSTIYALHENGYKIGMLTSNARENIDIFLDRHQLKVFDFIYTENNIFGKQFSLRNIMKKEKLDVNTTIYIGDEVRDVEACHVMELDVIAVTWGFSSKSVLQKYKPTHLADKPEALLKILGTKS